MLWLKGVLEKVDPVLVVVDTLQHLLGVSDLNDYARVVSALGPVLGLVRSRRAHIMLVHHAGKGDRTGFDAILGSTAIVGTVDVALLLKRRDDNTRTLMSLQRTGDDLPESVLVLDAHQEPRLEGTKADYDARQAEDRVEDWLRKQSESVGRPDVLAGVEGDANVNTKALYALVKSGKAVRTGQGVKGDPFLYACMTHIPHATMQESKTGQQPSNDGIIPACSDQPKTTLSMQESEPVRTLTLDELRDGCWKQQLFPRGDVTIAWRPSERPPTAAQGEELYQWALAHGEKYIRFAPTRTCPKGHPLVAGICPECERSRFLAALDAEATLGGAGP